MKQKFFFSRCQEWLYKSKGFFGFKNQTYPPSLPLPHLNFLPALHEIQIWLGGTLTLVSAFQRNFSIPNFKKLVCRLHEKKFFTLLKNCREASKPTYSDELHHAEFESTIILRNLLATFFLSQHLFQKFSIKFFLLLDIDPKISGC